MIKRTIKVIKPLKMVIPGILAPPVSAELGDTVLHHDTAGAVNKWIAERRENAGLEKERSKSMISAWRTKQRLRRKKPLSETS